jgi:ABC-type Mn2+/Zn2+ transport system permease subunit
VADDNAPALPVVHWRELSNSSARKNTMPPSIVNLVLIASAIGVACAVLSVIVVIRRWAFIGEGISHAGFGGIGTAWLLSLVFPAMHGDIAVYAVAVVFCVGTALAIGLLSRRGRVSSDAAIGIFLFGTLAWGFVALAIYNRRSGGSIDWERYLLGDLRVATPQATISALALATAVLVTVFSLRKEIMAYCFDPMLAQVSGVRSSAIHYLLMVLLAIVVVIGMGIAGNLLIPALLVLPGATALLLGRQMGVVLMISMAVSLVAVGAGLASHALWPAMPIGPAIVLALFVEFMVAYLAGRRRGGEAS